MALIRGVQSLFPCPRCLIPEHDLGDLSKTAPLRTSVNTQATLQNARGERLLGEKEETLKAVGLRDVDVRHIYYYYCVVLLHG
jgi:hypothetical protein